MKQTQLSYPTLVHAHSSTLQPAAAFEKTYSGLSTAAARIHTLRDGELLLYKRSHSRVWQCRFKLFANEWHRQTTKRTVLADAVRVASELYDEARFWERMGLAPARKTFSQIAALTVEEMRRDLATGTGKKVYVDDIQVIERYLVPFFGDRQLQMLKHKDIAEFDAAIRSRSDNSRSTKRISFIGAMYALMQMLLIHAQDPAPSRRGCPHLGQTLGNHLTFGRCTSSLQIQ